LPVAQFVNEFSGRRYINLESYKKNGEPKRTPVQSLGYNGLLYVRTDPKTWKLKRIKSNPHIRIVLSDRNGKPLGAWVDAEASIVEGVEKDRIQYVFRKEYGSIGSSIVNFVAWLRRERLSAVISIKLNPNMQTEACNDDRRENQMPLFGGLP
jgi:PPOX class probable F420-dependent enzyme